MLTEYALTPHLFDDEYNQDVPGWLERLRAFGNRLLPTGRDHPFNTVISDLYGSSWFKSGFLPLIYSLQQRQSDDPSECLAALNLLKAIRPRIERHLVNRPSVNEDFPVDEEQWVSEAIASSEVSGLSIHQIVTSSKLPADSRWTLLDRTQEESFWEDAISVTRSPRANLGEQLGALRRMCSFYGFLAFASPHLDVYGSTDLTFAIELVKLALDRPRGFFPVTRIDLHTKGSPEADERQLFTERVLGKLSNALGSDAKAIRLFLWPTMLERHLLVGRATRDSKPAVVWALSMTHVVRPDADGPDQENPTFSVMPTSRTSRLASRYYSNTAETPYHGSPFTI